MTFGDSVLSFYENLDFSSQDIPDGIEVMIPMKDARIKKYNQTFYQKYYDDEKKRIFLIGINPGRFGAGITGIPFTDPIHLEEILHIKNELPKRHELSSRFVYDVVRAIGGPEVFFSKCYMTAVSPLGFILREKNINYYDNKELSRKFEDQFALWLKQQVSYGANTKIAFSLGSGKNLKVLEELNFKHQLFQKILALPHPRWVMQYRYPGRKRFVDLYVEQISKYF